MTLLAGLVVLGIAIVVIMLLVQGFSCKHAWEFVDKTEFPSRLEEAIKHGVSVSSFWNSQLEAITTKRVVIVLRCPKCGATKVMRESN